MRMILPSRPIYWPMHKTSSHLLNLQRQKLASNSTQRKQSTSSCTINEDPAYHQIITSLNGNQLKEVQDFKYLGSYVSDSRKDFLVRKGQAWNACNKLDKIWKSNITTKTKILLFRSCIESILLYGAETWTMKKVLQNRLDGIYTRLLMRVKNLNWKDHPTKPQIYGDIPPISSTLAKRRARFAGHCHRAKDQIISDLLLWQLPTNRRGQRPFSYIDIICRDTGIVREDINTAMNDRNLWKSIVESISAEAEG